MVVNRTDASSHDGNIRPGAAQWHGGDPLLFVMTGFRRAVEAPLTSRSHDVHIPVSVLTSAMSVAVDSLGQATARGAVIVNLITVCSRRSDLAILAVRAALLSDGRRRCLVVMARWAARAVCRGRVSSPPEK